MAKQRFERDDFFGKDLTPFDEFIAFNKLLDLTTKKVESLASAVSKSAEGADPATAKGIKEINKALDQSLQLQEDLKKIEKSREASVENLNKAIQEEAKATEELTKEQKKAEKQQKQLQKEQEKLNDLSSEGAVELQKLRIQQAEARKESRKLAQAQIDAAASSDQVNGSYARQSRTLNTLRAQYKDLVIAGEGNSEAAAELRGQIIKLDKELKELDESVGQNFRSVGDYEKGLRGLDARLGKVSKTLATFAGLFAAGGALRAGIRGSQDGLDSLSDLGAGLDAALSSALGNISEGIFGAIKAFQSTERSVVDPFAKEAAALDILGENLAEIFPQAKAAGEAIASLNKESRDFLRDTRDDRIEIAKLVGDLEELTIKSDDNTRSLKERRDAGNQAFSIGQVALQKQVVLLEKEVDLLDRRAKTQEKNAIPNQETLNELTEKEIELENVRSQQEQLRLQNIQRISEIESDQAELRLDILIDNFDNQKTVNERIIADERRAVAERQALLDETNRRFEKSVEDQIKEIIKLEKKTTELQGIKVSPDLEALISTTGKLTEEFDNLFSLDDDQLIQNIEKLGLSEIIQTRLLEVIRERRTATQDLEEAQRDLNEAAIEEVNLINEKAFLEDNLAQLRENGALTQAQISENRQAEINNEIDAIDREIELRKKSNQQITDLQVERIKKEIELEEELLESKKDIQKEEAEIIRSSISLAEAASRKLTNTQLKNIDRRLEASRKEQSTLEALAQQGSATALEELQRQKRIEAEELQRRERVARRQRRIEAIIAGVKVYAAKVEEGDANPVASTLTDVSTLIAGLSQLKEGTDYVDSSSATKILPNGPDAYISRLDKGERVISASENRIIGDRSNAELARTMDMVNKGLLVPFGMTTDKIPSAQIVSSGDSMVSREIVSELKSLKREVQNGNGRSFDWDTLDKIVTEKVRQGNKHIENKYKLRKYLG